MEALFDPKRIYVGNKFRRCAVRADDVLVQEEPPIAKSYGPLAIPSFPKTPDEWGYAGSRYQGPNRAFSLQGASSYEEHIQQSGEMPFLTETGFRTPPGDLQEGIRFIAHRGNAGIRGFWLKKSSRIQKRAQDPMPVKSPGGTFERSLASETPRPIAQRTPGG